MAETEKTKLSVEKKLMVGLVVSILLSTVLIRPRILFKRNGLLSLRS